MDARVYPVGSGSSLKPRHVNGILVMPGVPRHLRMRIAVADLTTTGTENNKLLPALPGFGYRITDAALIAVGGAVTTATSVDILGTRAGAASRSLVCAVAGLGQSVIIRIGAANAVMLANGGSFTVHDQNTPLHLVRAGSAITVATAVDILMTYVVE